MLCRDLIRIASKFQDDSWLSSIIEFIKSFESDYFKEVKITVNNAILNRPNPSNYNNREQLGDIFHDVIGLGL